MSPRYDLGEPPSLGFAGSTIDRAAELRHDATAIATLQAVPGARTFVIGGDLVCLQHGTPYHDPAFAVPVAEALGQVHERAFLGRCEGTPLFALAIDRSAADLLTKRDDLVVTDLRSIATSRLVAPEHVPPLAEAKALLGWHARHRFCANCGAPTQLSQAGWRRDCPACGAEHFPRTDPVAIMLVVDGERCLLGRQARFAKGMWSCLAGFLEPGETIEEAVRRETREEAGVECGRVAYFASQPWPFPTSLMIGCHAQALTTELTVDHSELEDARWFGRDEVAAMMLRRRPDGLVLTHPFAIAHHLVRAWLESDGSIV